MASPGISLGPKASQIEICTFGPGNGECSVIHLGNDNWIVVDSCYNKETGKPAALEYLQSIGVNPLSVRLVVATHWHDDHIRGMAEQLSAFENAVFCSSPALSKKEFIATVVSYESRHGIVSGSGATELCEVLNILRSRNSVRSPRKAAPARPILIIPSSETGQGFECRVTSLSPSDVQVDKFFDQLGGYAPLPLEAKRRAPDLAENDLSIVLHIQFGEQSMLLGADLEETGNPELGWSAVVSLQERPQLKSCIFKVPHHGSKNGHLQSVWDNMLTKNSLSVVTPWSKGGRSLPKTSDVARLASLTYSAFLTSNVFSGEKPDRPYAVEKQIKETVISLRPIEQKLGWIRFRNGGSINPLMWEIEKSDEAVWLV